LAVLKSKQRTKTGKLYFISENSESSWPYCQIADSIVILSIYSILNIPNISQYYDGLFAEVYITKSWFVDTSPKDTNRFSIR